MGAEADEEVEADAEPPSLSVFVSRGETVVAFFSLGDEGFALSLATVFSRGESGRGSSAAEMR